MRAAVFLNHAPPGFEALPHRPLHYTLMTHLALRLLDEYESPQQRLTHYEITNEFSYPLYVTPTLFYQAKVQAIALGKRWLAPKERTSLYLIQALQGDKHV